MNEITKRNEVELTCGEMEASCRCRLTDGHAGPHECACEGSWTFDEDGEFVVVAYPNPARRGAIV